MRLANALTMIRAALRVTAISLPVLAAFAATVLPAAAAQALVCDPPLGSAENVCLATVCALIAWLFLAAFHVKHESFAVSFHDRHGFLAQLRTQLKELGYVARRREVDRQVFRPAFQAFLFGGTIRVRVKDRTAYVSGPKLSLEILRKRLRMHNHLRNDMRTFWDAQRRRGGQVLKRVQITMRVNGPQGQAVYNDIAAVLAREGAEVLCDVSLLAQSDSGFPDSTVDVLIRDCLAREKIPAVIRKEHLHPQDTRLPHDGPPSAPGQCLSA
jgi:hypothetical protein